jgi:DNA-binding response OmpR family regulator
MEKVLIVNSDKDTMSLLKSWLEKKSYEVKYTDNVEEVPHLVKAFKPSVVLADIHQKEAVEKIKESKETSSVPVILMTGHTKKNIAIDVPVDDVIEKPFDIPLLEKKIRKLIS